MRDPSNLLSRRIQTFSPMTPGDPFLAMIEGLGFVWREQTAFKAAQKAQRWREKEAEKIRMGPKRAAKKAASEAAE